MNMTYAIVLHVVLTLFWFTLRSRQTDRQHALAETAVVFFLPAAGFLALLVWEGFCQFSQQRSHRYRRAQKLRDTEPLGRLLSQTDAMPLGNLSFVQDDQARRRIFTTAIKQEVVEKSDFLREAVNDQDREISYYAVSLLKARSEKIQARLEALELKLKKAEGGEKTALLKQYAKELEAYLEGGYVTSLQRRMYENELRSVALRLSAQEPEQKTYRYLSIRLAISLEDFPQAEQAIALERQQNPQAEEPLYLALQLAVARHDLQGIRQAARELAALPGKRSPQVEQAVRYWGGEPA